MTHKRGRLCYAGASNLLSHAIPNVAATAWFVIWPSRMLIARAIGLRVPAAGRMPRHYLRGPLI